jgi:hypothetical protein
MTLRNVATESTAVAREGFGENPASITFVFQDITNWKTPNAQRPTLN